MQKENPVPSSPATKTPKVDGFVTDYLKATFPRNDDAELMKVQSTLLKMCGPMACMRAELIENNLLSDPNTSVNKHDVLNTIQRTIVLLGNTNKMLSQLRCSKILAAVDTSLINYGQKSQPESGEFLFGSEFTKYLRGEVETNSSLAEVVSLSKIAITPTTMYVSPLLVGLRTSFFKGDLPGSRSLGRVVIRLHHTINHANQEALSPTDPGERADLTQYNQRDFRSVTTAKGTITIIRTRYNTDRATCVHTSW